jgi:hypothetical protein
MSLTYRELTTHGAEKLEKILLDHGYPEGTRVLRISYEPFVFVSSEVCIILTEETKQLVLLSWVDRGMFRYRVTIARDLLRNQLQDKDYYESLFYAQDESQEPIFDEVPISDGAWKQFVHVAQGFDPYLPQFPDGIIVVDGIAASTHILILGGYYQVFFHQILGRQGEILYRAVADLAMECLNDPLYIQYFDVLSWILVNPYI